MITHMRFRRGLLAMALAASLSIVWTQEAQASPVIVVIPVSQFAYANTNNMNNNVTTDGMIAPGDPSPAAIMLSVVRLFMLLVLA